MIKELAHLDADFAPAQEMAVSSVCPNGFLTVRFPCGTEKTFRIYTKRASAREHKGKRLLAILIGPSGTDEFEDFGFVTESGIETWPGVTTKRLKDYADIVWAILVEPAGELARGLQESGYRLSLDKRCIVCNRELNPAAWKDGINEHCRKKWGGR
jgi:hypothetical protein